MTNFVLQDETFYHGTRAQFEHFRPLSHFGSWDAASEILKSSPTIKKEKLDGLTDITNPSSNNATNNGHSIIIPVQLKLTNTYEIQDFASCHDLKSYMGFVLYHIEHDLKIEKTPEFFDYIFKTPFKIPYSNVVLELTNEGLYKPQFEELDRYHLAFQRVIQYFESLGYDGFHYVNQYEDAGHISYIVFRPENILRLDIKNNAKQITNPSISIMPIVPMREATNEERVRKHSEDIYHDDLFEQKIRRTQDQTNTAHAEKIKAHYAKIFYTDIFPKIKKISKQPDFGYHGLSHTEQTVLFGLDIAITCTHDPMPVMLACALHDIYRTNNDKCHRHGAHAVPFARKFLAQNFPRMHKNTIEEIVGAVKHHTDGQIARRDLTAACMWDADRIRLAWIEGYNSAYFSTSYGRQLASMSKSACAEYITKQNEFLIRHKFKTAEQIIQEQQMNIITIQREFNTKYR